MSDEGNQRKSVITDTYLVRPYSSPNGNVTKTPTETSRKPQAFPLVMTACYINMNYYWQCLQLAQSNYLKQARHLEFSKKQLASLIDLALKNEHHPYSLRFSFTK